MEDAAAREAQGQAAEVPHGPSLTRPIAMTALALASAGLIWLAWDSFQASGSIFPAMDTPLAAAALLLVVVVVMSLAVLVIRPESGERDALVATAGVWGAVLFIALVVAWFEVLHSDRQVTWPGTPITSGAQLDAYLAQHVTDGIEPVVIPTGVLLKSLEFLNGDNVQMTGFVWQRYGPDVPDDLDRGVVVAEGIREAYDLKEAYRYEENGIETIGWYFAATVRQPFEYAEFPFDEQNAWVRLWARDMSEDVILVPDFAAYDASDTRSLPGLEPDFVYSGWTPVSSGFSLSAQPHSTSFGVGDASDSSNLPELYFNLILRREFAGPFFEHFTFAIAAACLVFGLLLLTTNDEELKGRFQLSTSGVLGAATGLLFGVILKHNQIRSGVGARGVIYIEVIPIILYGAIIFVALNAILLASPVKVKFIEHRNNLLPVLAYWPVLFGLLLLSTVVVLFRA
jgi:hypothetical protein